MAPAGSKVIGQVEAIALGLVGVAAVYAVLNPGGRGVKPTLDFIRAAFAFFVRLIGGGPGGWARS